MRFRRGSGMRFGRGGGMRFGRGGGMRFGRGGGVRILTVILLAWLIIGAVAAGQRHYYSNSATNCAGVGTVAVTILAGPLNYLGVNPKITTCELPQPS